MDACGGSQIAFDCQCVLGWRKLNYDQSLEQVTQSLELQRELGIGPSSTQFSSKLHSLGIKLVTRNKLNVSNDQGRTCSRQIRSRRTGGHVHTVFAGVCQVLYLPQELPHEAQALINYYSNCSQESQHYSPAQHVLKTSGRLSFKARSRCRDRDFIFLNQSRSIFSLCPAGILFCSLTLIFLSHPFRPLLSMSLASIRYPFIPNRNGTV